MDTIAAGIRAFDQQSLSMTGFASLQAPSLSSDVMHLQRWGSNGFAFHTNNVSPGDPTPDQIVLLTSAIASNSNWNPLPAATLASPSSIAAAGPDTILTINGTGFVTGSTIEWNNVPRLSTIVSSTQIKATIYASDIAAPGTAQLTVVSPGPGGGVSAILPFPITVSVVPPAAIPTVVLSATALTFTSQTVATTSAPQMLTISNLGNADLTGIALTLAGTNANSFTQATTCSTSLPAGRSCNIAVSFMPVTSGALSAVLSIADNASGAPQVVTLRGLGAVAPSFAVAGVQSGPPTGNVPAGQPADFPLQINPAAGYSGTIHLACKHLPPNAACTITPATLQITNGANANFTVTIATQTSATSAEVRLLGLGTPLLAVLVFGPASWRRAWRQNLLKAGAVLLLAAGLPAVLTLGCGGASTQGANKVPSPTPTSVSTPPGSYTIIVSATDGSTTQELPLTLVVQ